MYVRIKLNFISRNILGVVSWLLYTNFPFNLNWRKSDARVEIQDGKHNEFKNVVGL